MFRKCLSVVSGVALLSTLGAVFSSSSYASPARQFFCDTTAAFPKTRVQNTKTGETRTLIVWTRNTFADIGYDNLTRCQIVSAKFQQAYNANGLRYLTVGRVNNLSVICATVAYGSCNLGNTLFTVRPGVDAAVTLQQLFDRRVSTAAPILNETAGRPYIDMEAVISSLQDEEEVDKVEELTDTQTATTPQADTKPSEETTTPITPF